MLRVSVIHNKGPKPKDLMPASLRGQNWKKIWFAYNILEKKELNRWRHISKTLIYCIQLIPIYIYE